MGVLVPEQCCQLIPASGLLQHFPDEEDAPRCGNGFAVVTHALLWSCTHPWSPTSSLGQGDELSVV